MTSESSVGARHQLYVWVWLPGAGQPVVAGVLTRTDGRFQGQEVLTYTYARSFRERPDAIALFTPELPLQAGTFDPTAPGPARGALVPAATGTGGPVVRSQRRSLRTLTAWYPIHATATMARPAIRIPTTVSKAYSGRRP